MRVKPRQPQEKAPLQAHSPTCPFETLSIDILGPYKTTKRGNKYIIMVEDVFSKWVEAKAVRSVKAHNVILYLEEEIVARFGPPKMIISDQASIFTGNLFTSWCRRFEIEQTYSAIFHQQANPVERRIQELKKVLRALLLNQPDNTWDEQLPRALYTLRNRENDASGTTPAKLVFGNGLPQVGDWRVPTYAQERAQQEAYYERVAKARHRRSMYRRRYVDRDKRPPVSFQPGDEVMVRTFVTHRNVFEPAWDGPFRVERKISEVIYTVDRNGTLSEIHVNDLRPAPQGTEGIIFGQDDDELEDEDDSEEDDNQPGSLLDVDTPGQRP